MASDTVAQKKHDVFINFRGKDTRKSFISHLRPALERNGIDAFTDKGLKAGEEISPTLSRKISESQVSVVVFSPNYADSRWCLDELVRIMECKEADGQTVLPVFLQGVEPTHVRKQTGAFGNGFGRLIQDNPLYADKEESWRLALKQAADISGCDFNQISEGKIIEKLLNRVQSILGQLSSDDSHRRFIGIERVDEVESFMSLPKVRCIGIWGMGGSGKTTLAKKLYCRIYKNFDGACFVENVGQFAGRHELNRLRKYLLSQLLGKHDQNEGPPIIFRGDIQRKLRRKRVLIILDDVSDASQLIKLIGDCSFYCPQSKIIATSRDKQVLKNVCEQVYEVQKLNDHEALQLLQLHIFKQRQPTTDQMELLKEAIKYTQGLPLALVVLGRNLFDKDITIWKSELAKLSDIPDLQIMKILRTSFDGLEDTEKNIFLDIACLMDGWNKDRVESILDACGFYAVRGIARLIDKALITISDHTLRMHDLVKQMGQHIVFHEGIKATGRPSRLWRYKEIAELLTKNQETQGTRSIEVISMDLSKDASIKLKSRVFKKMTGLRVLHFHGAFSKNGISLPGGLEYLTDGLFYLRWDLYPLSSLPPRFNPESLVELRMVNSQLKQLWTGEVEPCLPNLKSVDLSGSKDLTTLPNFRNALKLETLSVPFCKNLKGIPDSIQHLVEIKYIVLHGNGSLTGLPELSQLTKLEILSLMGCSKIRDLPQLPRNLISLNLSFTKIKALPPSIQGLSQLEDLLLCGCEELEGLPDSINELKNLKELDIGGCSKLSTLPANFGDLKSLELLIIGGSPLNILSESITHLSSLLELSCQGYKGDALVSLKSLVSLTEMYLQRSNLKSLPEDIKCLTNLFGIYLSNCKSLSYIPELPSSLRYLDASNCTSLQKYTHRSFGKNDLKIRIQSIPEKLHLKFDNCFNLEQEARSNIWRDFWLRVQFVLVPLVEVSSEQHKNRYQSSSEIEPGLKADVCFPGNEVPKWFKYSKTGSNFPVKTNFRRLLNPLRFIFCMVVAVPNNFSSWKGRLLTVTCQCKTKLGENFDSSCSYSFDDESILFQTEHTILWCGHFGPSRFYLNEAMFQFSAAMNYGINSSIRRMVPLDDAAIVKCGVTPIGRTFGTKWLPVIQDDVVEKRASRKTKSEKRRRGKDIEKDLPCHKRGKEKPKHGKDTKETSRKKEGR